MIAHNERSENSYTSKYRPWELKIAICVESRSVAMKIEKYLKKKNRNFINRVIKEQELRDYITARYS
jgi:predicted GIY-YIG superfamily endonuclease